MVNVFVTDINPRIEYVFRLVFNTILNTEVFFYTSANDFMACKGLKINYSHIRIPKTLNLRPHQLLFHDNIDEVNAVATEWDALPAIFPANNSFIPFDLFAATFYLVTRYEEYIKGSRDLHGRFEPKNSTAYKLGFIDKPLVNMWALKLAALISSKDKFFKYKQSGFKYLPTFDIDNAWAYKHKPLGRQLLSAAKDLLNGRFSKLKERAMVLAGLKPDPYDNYYFMLSATQKHRFRPLFFFLMHNRGTYDRALSSLNPAFRNLLVYLSQQARFGIHPSYASNNAPGKLAGEITRLREITGKRIKYSRQHFLKLEFPGTYQQLLQNEITVDYSMGYPDLPGFRASIATPFLFFDLEKNKTTKLKIVPFQVMDTTLSHYMGFDSTQSMQAIEKLMKETAHVGGLFVSLWHNEWFSNDERRELYSAMTRMAANLQKKKKRNVRIHSK